MYLLVEYYIVLLNSLVHNCGCLPKLEFKFMKIVSAVIKLFLCTAGSMTFGNGKRMKLLRSPEVCKSQFGFTLIEVSIVLVIIGFIVGGIVTGQQLIRSAQLVKQVKQITDLQTAFITFQSKYNCTPGDCLNATKYFGTSDAGGNAINNGNGNGVVDTFNGTLYDDGNSTWPASTEMWGVFQQLGVANMFNFIPSNPASVTLGTGVPQLIINPAAGFFVGASYNFVTTGFGRNPMMSAYQKGNNVLWMVACNPTSSAVKYWDDFCGVFIASDIQSIDKKIDDGMPLSGNFFGFGGFFSNNDCLNGSSYKITNTTAQCQGAYIIN